MSSLTGGVAKAFSGVGTLLGGAITGTGGILKFGWNHPILTGILGVVGYSAIKGASNAKGNESVGIAAANGVGSLFEDIANMVKNLGKGAVEAGKQIGDTVSNAMTGEDTYELAQTGGQQAGDNQQQTGGQQVDNNQQQTGDQQAGNNPSTGEQQQTTEADYQYT